MLVQVFKRGVVEFKRGFNLRLQVAHLAIPAGHLGIEVVRRFRNANGTFRKFKRRAHSGIQVARQIRNSNCAFGNSRFAFV